MKKETVWAIINPRGEVLYQTMRCTRKAATSEFMRGSIIPWPELRKIGWRARKVTITYTA